MVAENHAGLNIHNKWGFKLGTELQFFEKLTTVPLIGTVLNEVARPPIVSKRKVKKYRSSFGGFLASTK